VCEVVVVVGSCVCEMLGGEQVWVKRPKLSLCGLVLGTLDEVAEGKLHRGGEVVHTR
jgi:hypothetical protein